MNEETRSSAFADAAAEAPERRPLAEHLRGIDAKSNGDAVKAAAASALADGWSRADMREALIGLGVGRNRIVDAIPAPPKPNVRPCAGLSPDYFREHADGPVFRFVADRAGEFKPALVSSPVKARYRTSDSDGEGWALVVEVVDERGLKQDVALPYSEIATDPSAAVGRMAAAGLRTHAKPDIVLGAVKDADPLPRAYALTKPGHHTVGRAPVFVLPRKDGILGDPPPGETVLWKGSEQFCRVRQAGTFAGWKANVVVPLNGIPIPMAMIGVMLASPAIPFLPPAAELNTVLHLFGDSSKGKTTSLQCGASV
jgi:Domain of unknown function (DUF927)